VTKLVIRASIIIHEIDTFDDSPLPSES